MSLHTVCCACLRTLTQSYTPDEGGSHLSFILTPIQLYELTDYSF